MNRDLPILSDLVEQSVHIQSSDTIHKSTHEHKSRLSSSVDELTTRTSHKKQTEDEGVSLTLVGHRKPISLRGVQKSTISRGLLSKTVPKKRTHLHDFLLARSRGHGLLCLCVAFLHEQAEARSRSGLLQLAVLTVSPEEHQPPLTPAADLGRPWIGFHVRSTTKLSYCGGAARFQIPRG